LDGYKNRWSVLCQAIFSALGMDTVRHRNQQGKGYAVSQDQEKTMKLRFSFLKRLNHSIHRLKEI